MGAERPRRRRAGQPELTAATLARAGPEAGAGPGTIHVVVAFPLGRQALSRLRDGVGARVMVRDIRQPGPDPDIVLCPPSSPQLIGHIRQLFPGAAVVVVELEDWLRSVRARGPISRALSAGASTYYVAPSTEALAGFLNELSGGPSLSIEGRAQASVRPGRLVIGAERPDARISPALAHEAGPGLPDEVRNVVARYLEAADASCPGLVQGLYLIGSVALRDFHPSVSDVDFIIVTATPPGLADSLRLAAVHADLRAEAGLPAFEGPYVTLDQLRHSPSRAGTGLFHLGGALQPGPEMRTPVEWTTLARHGITVRGPGASTLNVFTDPDELTAWTLGNLTSYWAPWVERVRDNQTQTATAMLTDWGVAWGVLGVSRLHYTLATGAITSKTGAGRHALGTLPAAWHPIITEALRCRPHRLAVAGPLEDAEDRRERAAQYIEFVMEDARHLAR